MESIILFLSNLFQILGLSVGCLFLLLGFFALIGAFVEAYKRSGVNK